MSRTRHPRVVAEIRWSTAQVALMFNVTQKTVVKWIEDGEFPGWLRLPGDDIRIPDSVLQKFVERHEVAPA